MAHVGYKRITAVDKKKDRQLEGVDLDKVFEDAASWKAADRPQLDACLSFIQQGDTLHVHSIGRLCRNMADFQRIVKELNSKGVIVCFHSENLTFSGESDPMNTIKMQLLGAVSVFERELNRERQREGIAAAKAKGKRLGRKAALSPEQVEIIRARIKIGQNVAQLSKEFKVSRQTIYASLERQKRIVGPVKCQICGAEVNIVPRHLFEAHPETSTEKYLETYPNDILFSALARRLVYRRLLDYPDLEWLLHGNYKDENWTIDSRVAMVK